RREGQQDVARGLAPEARAALLHQARDVAVADGRARERDALAGEGRLETPVGHDGADDASGREPPATLPGRGDDPEDVVAVQDAAGLVSEDRPVGAAVVRDAEARASLASRAGHAFRVKGPAAVVDVAAVGPVVAGRNVGAGPAQRLRSDPKSRAIAGVDQD